MPIPLFQLSPFPIFYFLLLKQVSTSELLALIIFSTVQLQPFVIQVGAVSRHPITVVPTIVSFSLRLVSSSHPPLSAF